jgi:hypothetical protein
MLDLEKSAEIQIFFVKATPFKLHNVFDSYFNLISEIITKILL